MEKAKKNKDVAVTKTAEQTVAMTATTSSPDTKRKPVAIVREDDVSASVWAREFVVQGSPKIFYSISLERSYKDRDGAWKYTKSFDADSLGKLVSVVQRASESITALMQP